ncbi:recombination directionality factor [Undibacterium griseum]|uniref:Hydrolase or metal-binding protein n=1 Tax=Undibacterium griseum TaxID=2762295 RepID=A0ABR6YJJ4_9BURK|nr:hydrolase or metal-binding protein [Undibacterium griseum]MBC3884057.1 hydrolase or metal-binding protein [Undibacterium griseum]
MIKGLALTPPVLGRISIGRIVEKNGKRLPEKDDQFTITTQLQGHDGWILHPYDEAIRKDSQQAKLRAIPVQMLFNDPDLNLRAEYSLFDHKTGRPLCVGNGETCRRFTDNGIQSHPCPSPDVCELAKGGACKPYGRLNVSIHGTDDLGSFIFRTTGYNSIRCLSARLHYYRAVSGNLLACMPLELRLRSKSTTQSHRAPIYYVDLTLRDGMTMEASIAAAIELHQRRQTAGYDQNSLDQAGGLGFQNGEFEDSPEDSVGIVEEFYNAADGENAAPMQSTSADRVTSAESAITAATSERPGLKEKLNGKVARLPASINSQTRFNQQV